MRVLKHPDGLIGWLLVLLLPTALRADLIFLKDGHVLQGTVRREVNAEFDPISREMVLIPKGFFTLDDGPRRTYFSPSQVRIVEKLAAPTEERVVHHSDRLLVNPRNYPPHLEVLEEGPWDLKKWERSYSFRSTQPYNRVGVKQGIGSLSPYFARVDAVTKFRWSGAYLTREWDPDTVLALLRAHASLQESPKDKPAQNAAKRMRLCDFLAQAGWYDHAERELHAFEKDHPDQKERIAQARLVLGKLRTRDEWEQLKNWYHAGRYEAVRKRLEHFPTTHASDQILADLRELKGKLRQQSDRLDETARALDDIVKEATTAHGKALASAVAVFRKELHPATVDRLDAFLGQYRDAQRRKGRGQSPSLNPDELLSLAVSGWLLGSPSAESQPLTALALWKTRQMLLEVLQEEDAASRHKIVADYLANVTPRIDLDEIAQVIDSLPPVEPAQNVSTQTMEYKAGQRREQATYHLKLPPEYSHHRPYPVLLLLHDIGQRPAQLLERFEKIAAEHGYILAAPQWARGLADDYGYTEREHDTVLDTLRDLKRRFQVDSDRIFLFGLGEGAKMAFDVGLAHPDCFAGVLPMAAGPSYYARRYWRNAQYLPFYVVNGTRGSDSQASLREQFTQWVQRGYPALWIEYKGRGTEFFSGELPMMFDWMRHQRRALPLRQLGTDGNGSIFGNEFCTMRPEDNKFYWLGTSSISPRHVVTPTRWNNAASPAMLTGRVDPATNEMNLRTQGLNNVLVWVVRDPSGRYLVNLDKPLLIRVGLRVYFNAKITPSLATMLEELHRSGDRKHLYVARVEINLR